MNSSNMWNPQNLQYCFDFVSGACPKKIRSLASLSALYMIMLGAIILTMGGNLVVIISISHFKQLHSPTNFLLLSLATTDFLLGFLVMPYSMVRSIDSCWYFGDWFCTFHTCSDIMLCTTSIFHLCFISVDRYYAVCQPLHYISKITIPVIVVFLFISWSVPCFFAFGLVLSELNTDGIQDFVASISCIGFCSLIFNKTWGVLASLIAFFIPGTVMVGIYVHIFTVAKKQARKTDRVPAASLSETKKISVKKESKAAKTLSIVMGVFILCWLPFFVLTITDPFINFSTPEDLYNAFLWLGYFNSTFNPIIYGLFYPWFRKAFKIILTGMIFSPDSSTLNVFAKT
ncbi:trace amine-associated receptor 4-like [Microcaecilia unicolor]|uniref:Trace amine-associated receptor 4-like n=1 Tax=Microcaecilia unicolor TaxID=1415580 RepID=A0A6P7XFX0_9AMPH|nr:trace amine-associated receptor 4-like [Microcaecilia unicolor]